MLGPVAAAFFLGIAVMGWVADPDTFEPKTIKSAASPNAELPDSLQGLSRGGLNHWRTIYYFGTHIPEVCWGDNAVNEFQKRQCGAFWDHLEMGAGLSLLPFGIAWVFWRIALGSILGLYRKARKRIEGGKPIAQGVVTNPAQAPGDLFSRMYCLRTIGVQLQGGKQVKVYVPLDSPEPQPGQKMAVFEPVNVMGESRHFAMIYAPHVAVIAGVRRA